MRNIISIFFIKIQGPILSHKDHLNNHAKHCYPFALLLAELNDFFLYF